MYINDGVWKGSRKMYQKESFVIQMQRTATAAATFVAQTQPWGHGDVVTIQTISCVNLDSNNKDFTVGVKRYETDLYIETFDARTAGEYMSWHGKITIPSDYKVIVRFENPAAGDRYIVNVFGYVERWSNEVSTDGQ
jgi:hypothetical protein